MPFTVLDIVQIQRVTHALADSIRGHFQFAKDAGESEVARRFNAMLQQAEAILSELDVRVKNRT